MQIKELVLNLGQNILDLVFPITCLVCGKDAAPLAGRASPEGRGNYLCEDCVPKLGRLEKQLCLVCYKPSPFGKTHPDCVSRNTVDGAIAALTHKDKHVSNIIWTFKYSFVSSLSEPLSRLIVEAISNQGLDNYFSDFIIVPVPLHQRRLNWRGFNQASLLANTLAEKLGAQIDEQLVTRSKFTQPQVNLKASERKRNIENAFNLITDVANKKILLVDDLVTSGSTAHESAKLLKQAKASEIWIVSLAHG